MEHRDQIRFFAIQLLAWMIWDGVECKLDDRHMVDWLTAESFIDANTHIVEYVISQTSRGIRAGAFNQRFFAFIQQGYIALIKERERYLASSLYGEIKSVSIDLVQHST